MTIRAFKVKHSFSTSRVLEYLSNQFGSVGSLSLVVPCLLLFSLPAISADWPTTLNPDPAV